LRPSIVVIIPAFDEEKSIASVIRDIPSWLIEEIIVVDNNSKDQTAAVANAAGATVLSENEQGYGAACLKGMDYLLLKTVKPDMVVFMDGDYSDYGEQLPDVIQPILSNQADMVIGSRALGKRERGSMTFPQVFGNWLATSLLRWIYKVNYTDLGPFRAIRYESLIQLGMKDRNYGWTVEMQLKAARQKIRVCEVPVNYRVRIGVSKVSGTIKGTVMAGYKILTTIFKYI
jgi:glycosyltransferase involved in cell wall biosynthesis